MTLKLKYLIFLIIILSAGYIISRDKTKPDTVAEVETKAIVVEKKPVVGPKISAIKEPPTIEAVKTLKKKTNQTQKEITRETEKEFLAMTNPTSFSDVKEVRYQEIYSIYQKASFYLSEVAAGHLETNQKNLLKAFKGLITYFKEGSVTDQMDSALVIIQQERPDIFEESLNNLSKNDQVIIKTILKLQSESE